MTFPLKTVEPQARRKRGALANDVRIKANSARSNPLVSIDADENPMLHLRRTLPKQL
jgi:hypothetical protein